MKTAIILAGGFGTRLSSLVTNLPKPMAPVNGLPFLNYLLSYLKHYGIENVIFSTGHLAGKINSFYGNEFKGMQISYSHEETPLGTGGAIRLAFQKCKEPLALVMNGDSFFDADLFEFYRLHLENKAEISLALRRVNNASRYGSIETGPGHHITSFREKSITEKAGLINGGVYIMDKNIYLNNTPAESNFSLEKDFFEKQITRLSIKGFEFDAYFIDIGMPEDYLKAQDDFKEFKYK